MRCSSAGPRDDPLRVLGVHRSQIRSEDLPRELAETCFRVTRGLLCRMTIKVEEYTTGTGKNHYREWFKGLPVEYASKVAVSRARMMVGSLGNVKPIDGTLKEYRIDWGPGIRIYLVHDGDRLIVLLGGGTKNSQQADIKRAKALRDEYYARKAVARKERKG